MRCVVTYATVIVLAVACDMLIAQSSPPSADALLAAAVKQAQAQNKHILVDFGASWCRPCIRLKTFFSEAPQRQILEKHFVRLSLTIWEGALDNPGADTLHARWKGTGMPYYVFLTPAGEFVARGSERIGLAEAFRKIHSLDAAERRVLDLDPATRPRPDVHVSSSRFVWDVPSGPDKRVAISPDGQLIAYNYASDPRRVVIHDLATGAERPMLLTDAARGLDSKTVWEYEARAFSPDGTSLAYVSRTRTVRAPQFRLSVVATNGSPGAAPRVLMDGNEVSWIGSVAWSPDGKQIVVGYRTGEDDGHVGLLSLESRRLQELKSFRAGRAGAVYGVEGRGSSNWGEWLKYSISVSPTGRYVAFDLREEQSHARDIVLFDIQESRELPGVLRQGDDALVAWAPGDDSLLFTSDRTGVTSLWSAPVADGVLSPPSLVKPNVGELIPLGISSSGTLFHQLRSRNLFTLQTTSIDFSNGTVLAKPSDATMEVFGDDANASSLGGDWSHEGGLLAYKRPPATLGAAPTIGIGSADTRKTRVVTPSLLAFEDFSWLPGNRALIATGVGFDGRQGVYRIDADTGAASFVSDAGWVRYVSPAGVLYLDRDGTYIVEHDLTTGSERRLGDLRDPRFDPSGREMFYIRWSPGHDPATIAALRADNKPAPEPARDLIARDLRTGAERTVIEKGPQIRLGPVSPDGRLIYTGDVVATTTGEIRPLREPSGRPYMRWAPDSQSFLAQVTATSGAVEYWWVPVDAREPRKLDFGMDHDAFLKPTIAPASGRVTFVHREAAPQFCEIWAMQLNGAAR